MARYWSREGLEDSFVYTRATYLQKIWVRMPFTIMISILQQVNPRPTIQQQTFTLGILLSVRIFCQNMHHSSSHPEQTYIQKTSLRIPFSIMISLNFTPREPPTFSSTTNLHPRHFFSLSEYSATNTYPVSSPRVACMSSTFRTMSVTKSLLGCQTTSISTL